MRITQTQIDEATLLGKSAVFKLAYELAMEVKYGGKIGCCMCNLKLLWLYVDALTCIQVLDEEATPPVTEATNCLTNVKIKKLIGKINSMVTLVKTNPPGTSVPEEDLRAAEDLAQFDDSFSDSFS